jgi:hypothetical protein
MQEAFAVQHRMAEIIGEPLIPGIFTPRSSAS